MTKSRYLSSLKKITEVLKDYMLDSDQEFSFFYGFGDSGQQGWHCIQTDYPSFTVIFMGETHADAMKMAGEWVAEYENDLMEDEFKDEPAGAFADEKWEDDLQADSD